MPSSHGVLALLLGIATTAACARGAAPPTKPTQSSASASATDRTAPARADIKTEEVSYTAGDKTFKGFVALPANLAQKRPGVLVVHEWWGLNDYVRSRARMLAELGYVALAIDMYGEGRNTQHPADAKKFATEVGSSREEGARRFEAGRAALLARPEVDAEKIAAIGYCFGGAVVLAAARRGADLDLVASFHGSYATETPMAKGAFAGKLFIAHGAADSFTPPAQIAALKQELEQAGARYEFIAYQGAKHGFTNPEATTTGQREGMDVAYDSAADTQSWSALRAELSQVFPGT